MKIYLVHVSKQEIPWEGVAEEEVLFACSTLELAVEKANQYIKEQLSDITKYVSVLQEDWYKPLVTHQLFGSAFKWYETDYYEKYIWVDSMDLLG